MKLKLIGHDERYTVEQSLMNLLPGELPVYEEILPEDDTWGIISLEEGEECRVEAALCLRGKTARCALSGVLSGSDYEKEGQRRHILARAFYKAACELTGAQPPWGMLTGVRPDKLVTKALAEGKTPAEARALLERDYFVTPERSGLALETGSMALTAARKLEKNDIAVYIGIPFCPTRCAYCSFVSHSVERSFALVPPYVEALIAEIRAGGQMVKERGLRVRAFYMGGGTPTTLTAQQMDAVLTAFEESFDLT
ncbi:MAG: coproporphyrinogen dehydrogenase HemZ, partial [Oscillibacter sp.]|nr:coproporphyrinogen dehydrogenase HemZ [Oscillibacter sp.]